VTASGDVTVWFTQSRKAAKEGGKWGGGYDFLIFFFAPLRLRVIKILPERAFGPALKAFDSLLAGGDPIDSQSVAL